MLARALEALSGRGALAGQGPQEADIFSSTTYVVRPSKNGASFSAAAATHA